MKFEITNKALTSISADIIIVFAFEDKKKKTFEVSQSMESVDKALKGELTRVLALEKFKGSKGSIFAMHSYAHIPGSKIVVVGLGERKGLNIETLRNTFGKLAKAYNGKVDSLAFSVLTEPKISINDLSQAVTEGIMLGSYKFLQYKKKDSDERELSSVIISTRSEKENKQILQGVEKGEMYANATRLARDLVNDQAAVVTPTYLANLANDIAKKDKSITCKIFDRQECQKMGMEAFLGIARAAEEEPQFIFLSYKPQEATSKEKIALVGKGITFDTGGISLKPEHAMTTMKCDMAGAAAVLGVFSVISDIKPSFEVIGLIAATPNMVSGKSLVPGDIVKAMNGKTIEILNTDAEGRVTLADSLSFAIQEKATRIIDLATLTGACVVALGDDYAGLFSNNKELKEKLEASAELAGEKVWELPLPEEYKDLNKSDVADIANLAKSRWGGAISAALFLQEFVDEKPWVHLDIAGPAFNEKDVPLGSKGGSGFGVRTLLNYLDNKRG